MKERPIPFSGPMVRAILDGRKTVTRRLVRSGGAHGESSWISQMDDLWYPCADVLCRGCLDQVGPPVACPYGVPGDQLWARETWSMGWTIDGQQRPVYRADFVETAKGWCSRKAVEALGDGAAPFPYSWRPSIHMPRAASRISLKVLGVSVERLQDITYADIRAEGFDGSREEFAAGWDGINGKRGPWASNPWVWVIRFRRVS